MPQAVATAIAELSRQRRYAGRILAVCSAVVLSACTSPQAEVSPEGVLDVITPAMERAGDGANSDWIALLESGEVVGRNRLSVRTPQNDTVARVVAGNGAFRVVRRSRVNLLVSPFMSWQWRVSRHRGATHPVRMIIGFFGGDGRFGSRGAQPFAFLGQKLPAHDRTIEIVWGAQALARGALSATPSSARYTARGGLENTERWWTESLDLGGLYRRLWPKDEQQRVQVTFIGFDVAAAEDIELIEFKELALHR